MKNSKRMKTAVITLITAGLCVLFSGCPGAGAETGDETGSVTGRAFFTGGDSNAGIIVAIEKVEDGRAVSLVRQKAGRAVTSQGTKTTTDADGNYTFEKVAPGNYTVYAASRDSKEKAVALDVAVAAGKIATVEGLELTPVGHVSGTVTVDDTGSLGTLVFIAGTSYAAWTDEEGAFTISDVPAKTGYSIVVSRDGVSGVWKSADVVKGETTTIGTKNIVTDDPGSLRGLRIIYDGNHYDYGTLPVDTTSYQAGDTVSVPDPEDPDDPNSDQDLFGRESWAFAGWNTKPDGTGTAYFPASWHLTTGYDSDWNPIRGDLLQRDTVTFEDRDITLYAIWTIGWIDIFKDEEDNLSAAINWHANTAIARQDLTIPSKINGIPVTAIKRWAFMQCLVRDLVIPETLTSIGEAGFIMTNNLETITLSENITSIEISEGAFFKNGGGSISRITLGAGVDLMLSENENPWYPDWLIDFVRDYNAGGKKAGTYQYSWDESQNKSVWTLRE